MTTAIATKYLWNPYLPSGAISTMDGAPGIGKTYLALAIAAALSRGRAPYTESDVKDCEPITTLYLTKTDSVESVLKPRFITMGGDPARMFCYDEDVAFDEIERLEDVITRAGAKLVVFDPVQSYSGRASNATVVHFDMEQLSDLAQRLDVSILLLRHLGKDDSRSIELGSVGVTSAARSVMMIDYADGEDGRSRVLAHTKSNFPHPERLLGFTIENVEEVEIDGQKIHGMGKVVWKGVL